MRKIIVAVGLALSLAACGDEPPAPTEGVVTALPYGGESYWYSSSCGQYKDVPKVKKVKVKDKKGKVIGEREERTTERKCIQNMQVAHVKPPWWQVCLDVPGRDDYCMNVAEHVWRSLSVGGYYRAGV